jgi:hypothetical protein
MDLDNATDVTYATTEANWTSVKAAGFNVVRFDAKISTFGGGAIPLSQALPNIATAVGFAVKHGLYIQLLNSVNPGGFSKSELLTYWGTVASLYASTTNVFYEMTNEPVAWWPENYTSQNIADLASIYDVMRAGAPNTPIAIWTFPNIDTIALTTIPQMFTDAGTVVPYGSSPPNIVSFHYYASQGDPPYSNKVIATVHAQYPLYMTEAIRCCDPNGYLAPQLESCERLGISWNMLASQSSSNNSNNADYTIRALVERGITWQAD